MIGQMASDIHSDLEDLRRPVLSTISKMGITAAWVWGAAIGPWLSNRENWRFLIFPLILLSSSAFCLQTSKLSVRWRALVFVSALTASLCLAFWWTASPLWLFYGSLVVNIASLLLGHSAAVGVTIVLTAVSLVKLEIPILLGIEQMIAPLGLVWVTAGASVLSTRTLYSATWWAMESQSRAWETAREVQERRAELRRALDSLTTAYDLLKRTSRELVWARREANQAEQAKARFVANISHELRTPLNVIVGFAEMLCASPEDYKGVTWSPALRQDLFGIWRNAEHILAMMDDILDLAQMEASRLPIVTEATGLAQLLSDTLVDAQALFRSPDVELRTCLPDEPMLVTVDRTRIKQVLLNLINNAVRYTAQGYVEVGAYRADAEAIVYVRDTGTGIPSDRLEVIFEEFERIDTSMTKSRSAGLGLAIAKDFVVHHGGRIWAESEVGQSSTFFFSLPITDDKISPLPSMLRISGHRVTSIEAGKDPIAVLASDRLVPRMLERYLEQHQVLTATSLPETISLVHDHHPRTIVVAADTSEQLSRTLGDAERLLDALGSLDVPVVACWFPTERRAGADLDADGLLIKPVLSPEVIAAIRNHVAAPRRVLVVEDEADMLRYIERTVHQEWPNCEVLTAELGRQAIVLAEQEPDIILLDLLLPDINGTDVLDALRSNEITESIPVIVVTARGPAEQSERTRRGRLHVLRNGSYQAGEIIRLVEAVTKILPPTYVNGEEQIDTPESLPGV